MDQKRIQDLKNRFKRKPENFDVMLLFWQLYPITLEYKQKYLYLSQLYQRIIKVFWKNIPVQIIEDFLNELIFFIQYKKNQEVLTDQNQTYQDSQNSSLGLTKDINLELKQKEENFHKGIKNVFNFDKTQKLFVLIKQEMFFDLMIEFYFLMTLNQNIESFYDFWIYILLKICKFQNNQQEQSILSSYEIVQEHQSENINYLRIHESLVPKFNIFLLKKGLIKLEIKQLDMIQSIGDFTQQTLNKLIYEDDQKDEVLQKFITSQKLFYIFFTIKSQIGSIQLNQLVFEKFLFENLTLKNNQQQYKNVMHNKYYENVDYIQRLDKMMKDQGDPYYLEKIKMYLFEQQVMNLNYSLNLAKDYKYLLGEQEQSEFIQLNDDDLNYEVNQTFQNEIFYEQINDKKFQQLENIDYINLFKKSHQEDLKILLIGKPGTNKKQICQYLTSLLKIEYIDIDQLINDFFITFQNKQNEEIDDEEDDDEEQEENQISEKVDQKQNNEDEDKEEEVEEIQLTFDEIQQIEFQNLQNGKQISKEFIYKLIINKINSMIENSKGFVLSFSSNLFEDIFLLNILNNQNYQGRPFSYIIEIKTENFSKNEMQNFKLVLENKISSTEDEDEIETIKIYNQYKIKQKEMNNKISSLLTDQEEELLEKQKEIIEKLPEEYQEQIKDKENNKLFDQQKNIYQITNLNKLDQLNTFFDERLKNLIIQYQFAQNIKYLTVNSFGQNTENIIKNILQKIGYKQQIYAKSLEGIDSFEAAYTQDIEEDQGDVIKRWSYFNQIDPVAYQLNKIVQGSTEFCCDYQNNVFLFHNEENKIKFIKNPKKYLNKLPKLNRQINLSLIGPEKCGIEKIAKRLSNKYGLKVFNVKNYLKEVFEDDKIIENEDEENLSIFAENYQNNKKLILDQIKLGQEIPFQKVFVLLYYENGGQLEIKFKEEEELKYLISKFNENKKKKKKTKVKKKKKSIKFDQLVTAQQNHQLKLDYYQQLLDDTPETLDQEFIQQEYDIINQLEIEKVEIKGYIFLNFPINEENFKLLTNFNIQLDKIVLFHNEELLEDLQYLQKSEKFYDYNEDELKNPEVISYLQDNYDENSLLILNYTSKQNLDYYNLKIKDFVDPFKIKIQSEDLIRNYNFEDINQDIEPMLLYKFGGYCPVNLIDRQWLVKGNKGFMNQIQNSAVFLFSEDDQIKFQNNYESYINKFNQLKDNIYQSNKKIFIMGLIGSGLKRFVQFISVMFKEQVVNVKKIALEEKIKFMKQYCISQKYKKGFNEEIYEDQEDQQNIKEINDDDDEFVLNKILEVYDNDDEEDMKIEIKIINEIFQRNKGIFIINFDLDEEEQKIFRNSYLDILKSEKLIFDYVLNFHCVEKLTMERIFDEQTVVSDYNKNKEIYNNKKFKLIETKRQELYKEKVSELEDENEKDNISLKLEDIEVDENDIEIEEFPDLNDELEKVKSSILSKRDRQITFCDEMKEFLQEYQSTQININTELNITKVQNRILNVLKQQDIYYENIFRKGEVFYLQDSEDNEALSVEKKIEKFVKSGIYTLSKYKFNNFLKPYQKIKSFDYNIIYKNEVYFVDSKRELDYLNQNLSLFNKNLYLEKNISKIKIFSLFKIYDQQFKNQLKQDFDIKIISIKEIIDQFYNEDLNLQFFQENNYNLIFSQINTNDIFQKNLKNCLEFDSFREKLIVIKKKLEKNKQISDDEKILLLLIKMNTYYNECNGIIIEEFPQNVNQAKLLLQQNIIPDLVLTFDYDYISFQNTIYNYHLKNYDQKLKQKKLKEAENEENQEQEEEINIEELEEEDKVQYLQKLEQKQKQEEEKKIKYEQKQEEFKTLAKKHVFFSYLDIKHLEYFYNLNFNNLIYLKTNKSFIANTSIIKSFYDTIKKQKINSFDCFNKGKPFSISFLNFSQSFIKKNLSFLGFFNFEQYLNNKEMVFQENNNLVYYKNKIYFVNQNNLFEQFIPKYERYLKETYYKPSLQPIPILLQKQQHLKPIQIFLEGYCPICNSKNKFIKGINHISMLFKEKFLKFCNLNHLIMFQKSPLIYFYQRMNQKKLKQFLKNKFLLKTQKEKLLDEIIMGLNQVLRIKPKYPKLSIKESYLIFLAIFLKMRNPNVDNFYKNKYKNKLDQFLSLTQRLSEIKQNLSNMYKFNQQEKECVLKEIQEILDVIQDVEINKENHLKKFLSQFKMIQQINDIQFIIQYFDINSYNYLNQKSYLQL